MSTTIDPIGSVTGMSAPIAAAIGSSIRHTCEAPAFEAASRIARRSTLVEPDGTQITISGQRGKRRLPCTLWMKCLIICSATSMSAMTPSRSGLIASIWSGVLPIISLASSPTAFTRLTPLIVSIATTEGSLRTTPRARGHRGLVEDDTAPGHVDDRVRGAEVDRHVVGRKAQEIEKTHDDLSSL